MFFCFTKDYKFKMEYQLLSWQLEMKKINSNNKNTEINKTKSINKMKRNRGKCVNKYEKLVLMIKVNVSECSSTDRRPNSHITNTITPVKNAFWMKFARKLFSPNR